MLKVSDGAKQGSAPKLQKKEKDYGTYPVSYTHLTLPTSDLV